MHEMSLAEGVRGIVEDAARAHPGRKIAAVVLEIGALAAVEVEALTFCLDVVLRGSVAEGARVDVETTPGTGWCMQCAANVPIAALYDACPHCGSYQVQPTGGTEMRVKALELE
ncbi:hydrogenase maturation nickel metallochaperone HypA [Pseudothauera rhizosphaerae]|uniref:Hydrogenase maturation factor HypA n=1 Tax=Pseudothauera rhizosphaerae TaxID=2565932 RepID=A0A4S4AYX0_9RHOO|nr:hydrogenase maturation nickel metallochaperone HypA [Pseudothauera rhizosphaerae]THF65335.1 hydrogenase maturation nickel metallochaperone HypA [Pseudothauera rhizosphaerae]